jgi:23S rRNA pseudouridine1911/1915/1917 synthase
MKILFENNQFIVVHKPSGLISETNPFEDSAQIWVENYLISKGRKKVFVGVVHRLDRVTEGILVFALKKGSLKKLNASLQNGEFRKKYKAELVGELKPKAGTLTNYLSVDKKNKKALVSDKETPNSKKSVLKYTVESISQEQTIVDIDLLTGRFHQIRAQFRFIGHPIIGDNLYQNIAKHTKSIHLKAYYLSFPNPMDETERLEFEII